MPWLNKSNNCFLCCVRNWYFGFFRRSFRRCKAKHHKLDLQLASDTKGKGRFVWRFSGLTFWFDIQHFRLVNDFLQGATTFNTYIDCAAGGISDYKWGHLAMTYTSIATLIILGDDLSRLDRKAIIDGKIVYLKVCAIQFMRFLYQVSLQFKGRTAALAHPSKATSTIWGSCTALAVSASCWTTGVV